MIGKCIHNTGASLGQPQRGHFSSHKTVFDLQLDSDYPVLGIGLSRRFFLLLLSMTRGRHAGCRPACSNLSLKRLRVIGSVLLDGVAASGGEASNCWVAKLGYPDLVRDESHSDALIEGDPAAREVFFREFAKRPNWQTPPQT
jgi:hypothetical protein